MGIIQFTQKKHDFNLKLLLDGSRGGDDDDDNELDYGWQEKEDPLQRELQNEKLQSQVKTEPDAGKLCYAILCYAMHLLVFYKNVSKNLPDCIT